MAFGQILFAGLGLFFRAFLLLLFLEVHHDLLLLFLSDARLFAFLDVADCRCHNVLVKLNTVGFGLLGHVVTYDICHLMFDCIQSHFFRCGLRSFCFLIAACCE